MGTPSLKGFSGVTEQANKETNVQTDLHRVSNLLNQHSDKDRGDVSFSLI